MILLTSLAVAIPMVFAIYFTMIKQTKYLIKSYVTVIVIGLLCFLPGEVYLLLVGIEFIVVGVITVWLRSEIVNKKSKDL